MIANQPHTPTNTPNPPPRQPPTRLGAGIVTPYSAQVKHVTELAQTRLRPFNAGDLEIQSVDAYQGREKELILISAVRSNRQGKVGFLGDWRRLNVAITRAKRGLVVVGDPRTLRNDPHWGAYLRWCLKRECVVPLAELKRLLQDQVATGAKAAVAAAAASAGAGAGAAAVLGEEGEAVAVPVEVVL
jgi:superfamily I DNA and/or RNA helicase